MDPRAALLLWAVGSIFLGLIVAFLVVQGEIRLLVLLLLAVLGLSCLSPRRGVYILTVFLPFMYLIRRSVLHFQEFDQRDPILVFPAITTMAMFFGVLIFYSPRLFRYFGRSALLKACVLLMVVFILEVFNPLQGGLLVGIAGAMFFIVPVLWCFLGLLMTREDISRILKIVVIIGLITAIYGLKQHYLGLSDVEAYELKSKHFYKTFGSEGNVRVMSTFASLGDFSLYLSVAGFFTFAYIWRDKKNLMLTLVFLINVFSMLWIAVRTSFLLLMFGIMMLIIIHGRNARQIFFRSIAAFLAIAVLYGVLSTYDPQRMYDQQFSTNPYVVHTLSGITHPTQENSLKIRLSNWAYIMETTITQYPAGRGLGSTTPAARKFEGGQPFEADSYFFELFYGCGILAAPVFAFIVICTLWRLLKLCLENPDVYLYKICWGLLCGVFLGSIFGLAARDTIAGPLAWLIIGWTIREDVDRNVRIARPAETSG